MGCDCNNTHSNICRQDIPYPQVSPESVPSLISNLVFALYGNITKSVVDGRVVWDIPCDPNNTAEADSIPREEGEGLLCYLLRLFDEYLSGGSVAPSGGLRWAYTGNGTQTVFSVSGALTTNSNGFLVTIDGVVQDPINYSISGSNLTMSDPIPNGSKLVIVSINGSQGATGGGSGVPAGGLRWSFIGNGSTSSYNLPGALATSSTAYIVAIDGVFQDPNSYIINNTTSPISIDLDFNLPDTSVMVIVSVNSGIPAYTGTGNPNNVITAPIGSIYSNLSGGANQTLWIKESGNNTNTGWIAK